MDIKIATDNDKQIWDEAVFNSRLGTIFHSWDWLKLIEHHAKYSFMGIKRDAKFYPIMVFDKQELVGILPVYYYKFPTFNFVCSPPPYVTTETLYLGPVTITPKGIRSHRQQEKEHQFITVVNQFLRNDLQTDSIVLKTAPVFYDPRPFSWDGYKITPHFTNIVDLNKNENDIWNGFGTNLRREINKAKKIGINIDRGGKEEYGAVLNIRDKRHKLFSNNEFYKNIFKDFYPNNLNIFFAKKEEELLTGAIILLFKNRLYAWVGAPRCEYKGTVPNDLLIWEIIKYGIKNNYKELEIMEADDKKLDPFKSKFNGTLVEYYTLEWRSNYFNSLTKVSDSIRFFNNLIRGNPN